MAVIRSANGSKRDQVLRTPVISMRRRLLEARASTQTIVHSTCDVFRRTARDTMILRRRDASFPDTSGLSSERIRISKIQDKLQFGLSSGEYMTMHDHSWVLVSSCATRLILVGLKRKTRHKMNAS